MVIHGFTKMSAAEKHELANALRVWLQFDLPDDFSDDDLLELTEGTHPRRMIERRLRVRARLKRWAAIALAAFRTDGPHA